MALLSTIYAGIAWDPHIRGALTVVVGVAILLGSIYLLLGTNMGARLGLLVSLAGLAGWMVILTLIWVIAPPGIGPRGDNATWVPVEIFVDGPESPRTEQADLLPQPQDLPTADQILADNPDLATEFPSGFVLSDLQSTNPDLLEPYLEDVELNGWSLVASSAAGETQASADVALIESGFFSAPTDYKKLNTFEYGGKPARTDTCPDAVGGSFLPDEPLCRAWHKVRTALQLRHPPHYAIVQVQQVIPQEARPGEAPPLPTVDPDAPVVSVVMVRDLGSTRFVPFLYLVISLSLFIFFVLVLHYREKTLDKNLEAAAEGA
jgi:hypothetical protein